MMRVLVAGFILLSSSWCGSVAAFGVPRNAALRRTKSLSLASVAPGISAMWEGGQKKDQVVYNPLLDDEESSELVTQLRSLEEYQLALHENRSRLMVVKMYSPECAMCNAIKTPYENMAAEKAADVGFYKANFYSSDVRSALRVTYLPTIVLLAGPLGVVEKFVCRPHTWDQLQRKVDLYSALMKRLGQGSGGIMEKLAALEGGTDSVDGGICRVDDPDCVPSWVPQQGAKGLIEKLSWQQKDLRSLRSLLF